MSVDQSFFKYICLSYASWNPVFALRDARDGREKWFSEINEAQEG